MQTEDLIDNLIETGRFVVDSDFDPRAFKKWRVEAFRCLQALVGPDHPYSVYFGKLVAEPEQLDLLAGVGILSAIREQGKTVDTGTTRSRAGTRTEEEGITILPIPGNARFAVFP